MNDEYGFGDARDARDDVDVDGGDGDDGDYVAAGIGADAGVGVSRFRLNLGLVWFGLTSSERRIDTLVVYLYGPLALVRIPSTLLLLLFPLLFSLSLSSAHCFLQYSPHPTFPQNCSCFLSSYQPMPQLLVPILFLRLA